MELVPAMPTQPSLQDRFLEVPEDLACPAEFFLDATAKRGRRGLMGKSEPITIPTLPRNEIDRLMRTLPSVDHIIEGNLGVRL